MQDLQDQDESVRIAVRALGDMRNAVPGQDFASRMSQMPLVSSVLSVYESGKNSSRVMKVCPSSLSSRPMLMIIVRRSHDGVFLTNYIKTGHRSSTGRC